MQRFIFGFLAATLLSLGLFGLAQFLVRQALGNSCVDCVTVGPLPTVRYSRPPEVKPRTPELPEKPSEPQKPGDTTSLHPPERITEPPRLDKSLFAATGPGIAIAGVDLSAGSATNGLVVTQRVEPAYPGNALRRGIEGEVEVEFTVQADGSVTDVRIISATPRGVFEESVRRAVLRWGFKPRREEGRAVATRVRQVLSFRLPRD